MLTDAPRRFPRPNGQVTRAEIEDCMDVVARSITEFGHTHHTCIYERLESELARLDRQEATVARAQARLSARQSAIPNSTSRATPSHTPSP